MTTQQPNFTEIVERIQSALHSAEVVLNQFTPGAIQAEYKSGSDPVTEADRQVDAVLRKHLLRDGEGWLSEESVDDLTRLDKTRVWVVDPLDGTREFVAGIPEFCVSVSLVENHRPIAGGICNPATGETFVGSLDRGVMYNGQAARPTSRSVLDGAVAVASRSEIKRGEWKQFDGGPFQVRPMGSVAYKLALVSAGLADLTFTLCPKNEWDVAAGAALVLSGGGSVQTLEGGDLRCNNRNPCISGLIACGRGLRPALMSFLADRLPSPALNPHG